MKGKSKSSKNRQELAKQLVYTVLILLTVVVIGICTFFKFYSSYIDKILYAERLSQMKNVTGQLFTGLEDAIENHWRIADTQSNYLLQNKPQTAEELYELIGRQYEANKFRNSKPDFIAVDSTGIYYTKNGIRGTLTGINNIVDNPERVSYVHSTMTTGITRLVMLQKLPETITFGVGERTAEITYYGMFCEMSDLNPYLDCKAYEGNSDVYILDNDGFKLFGNSGKDLLEGYNLYAALDSMEYLHGSSFSSALDELQQNGSAYSNAVLGGEEYYYSLYKMENSKWTLLFLVPSDCVATDTVALINMTFEIILVFSVILVCVATAIIYALLYKSQRRAISTEQKNNAELARLNSDLESANKAKSEFLSNVSHDIRTPLNAIIGLADIMGHDASTNESTKRYVRKIQSSGRHLLSLVNDVLDMSKIEANEMRLREVPVSLPEQVAAVDEIMRPQAEEHGHSLKINVHDITNDRLIADDLRLRQVVINLLSNSVKYTENGGNIDVDVSEFECGSEGRVGLRIVVSDNGCGMTDEFLNHAFESFTRVENSVTNKVQGTGLGLAISKRLVDLMGGTIRAESEVGKGSRFEVDVALRIDSTTASLSQKEAEGSGDKVLKGLKFLCAEDNELNAEILCDILGMQGAECTVYEDGGRLVEAFEGIKEGDCDAIFMDMQMPGMNGLEATKAIRNSKNPLGKTIPIIALTANAFSEDIEKCLSAGMNAHISKPVDIELLRKTVIGILK